MTRSMGNDKPRIRVPLVRASYFLWIAVPLALYVGYLQVGLPHLVFQYTYTPLGHPYDPHAPRKYHTCQYVGPYGFVWVNAVREHCGWIRFIRREEAG